MVLEVCTSQNYRILFSFGLYWLCMNKYVDDIRWVAGKNVGLNEPTSFLDHVCLGCAQRECKPNEITIKEYREVFESRNFCWSI